MRSYDTTSHTVASWPIADQASVFLSAVYGWMCAGLVITATTAWFSSTSATITAAIVMNRWLFWSLMIGQIGIVLVLSARVQSLAASTAAILFVVYSMLTGVTMAFILLNFTQRSVALRFLVTAGMFGGLAIYGTVTKRNLSAFGQFLFMGLLGLVLASVVGLFWHSDAFQFVLSFIGVLVFAGLVAFDAQRLKAMALQMPAGQASSHAIVGALALYLDFTNLFLFLLRFAGSRRE
jgi:FtsH-binding integral membrane protein